MTLPGLITGQDGHEYIRDLLAAVLAVEFANQFTLSGNDPAYDIDVYAERANPWDRAIEPGQKPLVNVWFDSSNFERQGSTVRAQRSDGSFNVDCYGFAVSASDGAGGQTVGDAAAAEQVQRIAGLARRILMAAEYTYLGDQRGAAQICHGRWVDSLTAFQPQLETRPAIHAAALRLVVGVHYKVDSPQFSGQPLEIINTKISREGDGKIILDITQDFTA